MPNVWFTSDTHFGHRGILKPTMACRRCDHFASVEEMDAHMVDQWNAVVDIGGLLQEPDLLQAPR